MKFSVITVCLNAGDLLWKTAETVLNQTYTDWELLIKDGGSEDGSVDRLREKLAEFYPALQDKVKICAEPDKSIYDAMNQAVQHASGEYFYFLNCGDLFYSAEALAELAEQMQDKTGALIFYGDVYDKLRGSVVRSNPKINDFACYRHVPCHQACVYHRELFAERGYLLEYRVRADYEHFLWSYFVKKANPTYLPVVLAEYEGGGFSETEENRARSAGEHRQIVSHYMGKGQVLCYRLLMLLTLQPLRTFAAENRVMGKWYQRLKRAIYDR